VAINFNYFTENQLPNFVYKVRADMPERLSISVPAVINNIYRSAVPGFSPDSPKPDSPNPGKVRSI